MWHRTSLVPCALTILTGFLVICLGAFFISSGSSFNCRGNLIMAYLLLPLGFVILLSGIFWSIYRQARKSTRMLRQHLAQGHLALATVDRPDFYPPAYEESLDADKQTCGAGGAASEIPSPLYTEVDLDVSGEIEAQPEAPPPYEESVTDIEAAAMSLGAEGHSQGCQRQGRSRCDAPSPGSAAADELGQGAMGREAGSVVCTGAALGALWDSCDTSQMCWDVAGQVGPGGGGSTLCTVI
ncbi:transmembrane protein 252 [Loxodonta africana]|uniref:transmembrane protein 252 n=1 Tax=Loxodonta africana TaxID=9785 RepID=UPI0030D2841D